MNICLILQIYLAMASSHIDTAKAHEQIFEGGQFLQKQCDVYQQEQAKKDSGKQGGKK